MTTEPTASKSLSYRRYTIVNIRHENRLTPHLCVIVDDDESFQEAAQDPHFQLVVTNVEKPVRRGAYVPIVLTHGHTFPASEEQIAEELKKHVAEQRDTSDLPDNETVKDLLLENIDNVADSMLKALSGEKESTSFPARPQLSSSVSDEDSDSEEESSDEEEVSEYNRPDLNTYRLPECVDGDWIVEVPTAFTTLSHLIYEAHHEEAPAFLIASNKNFKPGKSNGYSYDDFDFIVEYENYESEEFSDSTAEITKLREGEYVITTSEYDMGKASGVLLDKIVRIAAGDVTALEEASSFMDDFARLARKDDDRRAVPQKPRVEDTILHTMLSLLIDLYAGSSTEELFNTLYESSVLEGYEDSIEDLEDQTDIINNMIEVEKLFIGEGLHDIFRDIPVEYEAPKIPSNAKEADLAGFYSLPLTLETFPESMRELAVDLDFPFIYDNSILDNEAINDITVTSENAGELFLGMVIALAVRYERLKQIQKYGLPLIPFNVFLKIFQDTYESNYISDIIMFSIENIPANGTTLFRELAINHMPPTQEARLMAAQNNVPGTMMPLILTFPSVILLHYLNHTILDDGIDLNALKDSMYENNPLRDYVESLEDSLINLHETQPFGEEACPELLLSVDQIVTSDMSSAEIADAAIDIMGNAAKLSATSNTDFTPGTPEWDDYMVGFYRNLVQK